MPRLRPVRRFTLFDVMAMVAAAGTGMAMGQSYFRFQPALPYLVSSEHATRGLGPRLWFYACVPSLLMLTLALLPVRFLGPRPRLRRLLRLPGLTVVFVAVLASAVVLIQAALDMPAMSRVYFGMLGRVGFLDLVALRAIGVKDMIGTGVGFAWALLWSGGGWRAEATWVDRAGRLLGVVWIAVGLASWVFGLFAEV